MSWIQAFNQPYPGALQFLQGGGFVPQRQPNFMAGVGAIGPAIGLSPMVYGIPFPGYPSLAEQQKVGVSSAESEAWRQVYEAQMRDRMAVASNPHEPTPSWCPLGSTVIYKDGKRWCRDSETGGWICAEASGSCVDTQSKGGIGRLTAPSARLRARARARLRNPHDPTPSWCPLGSKVIYKDGKRWCHDAKTGGWICAEASGSCVDTGSKGTMGHLAAPPARIRKPARMRNADTRRAGRMTQSHLRAHTAAIGLPTSPRGCPPDCGPFAVCRDGRCVPRTTQPTKLAVRNQASRFLPTPRGPRTQAVPQRPRDWACGDCFPSGSCCMWPDCCKDLPRRARSRFRAESTPATRLANPCYCAEGFVHPQYGWVCTRKQCFTPGGGTPERSDGWMGVGEHGAGGKPVRPTQRVRRRNAPVENCPGGEQSGAAKRPSRLVARARARMRNPDGNGNAIPVAPFCDAGACQTHACGPCDWNEYAVGGRVRTVLEAVAQADVDVERAMASANLDLRRMLLPPVAPFAQPSIAVMTKPGGPMPPNPVSTAMWQGCPVGLPSVALPSANTQLIGGIP